MKKFLCGGIKTDNLIMSTFFYLNNCWVRVLLSKVSWFHVFSLNFSRVHMFYDDNPLKLVPESTQPGGVLSWMIVKNLRKNPKVNI